MRKKRDVMEMESPGVRVYDEQAIYRIKLVVRHRYKLGIKVIG